MSASQHGVIASKIHTPREGRMPPTTDGFVELRTVQLTPFGDTPPYPGNPVCTVHLGTVPETFANLQGEMQNTDLSANTVA